MDFKLLRSAWLMLAISSVVLRAVQASAAAQAPRSSEAATTLNWQSPARLHHGLRGTNGTLLIDENGVEFRSAKDSSRHWSFVEIQTFDLLSPRTLVLTGYENRGWHRHGERKFRFDLSSPIPSAVAAEFAQRVGKPVRNGVPDPEAQSFATISARHRTLGGGSNGVLRFRSEGIDYVTQTAKEARSWRWADIQTLANPDPYHLRLVGYRETFVFELKQPMSRELFDWLWDEVYARDLTGVAPRGQHNSR